MKRPNSQALREMHATICHALADPTRIALLYELGDGPRNVNQLTEAVGAPQATISRHLKTLREQSLVATKRDGNFVFYSLADASVLDALDIMFAIKDRILAHQQLLMSNSEKTGKGRWNENT